MTPGHVRGETARDVLMRTKRLFTSGHWCEGTMHRTVWRDGELVEAYCLVGGLRHSSDSGREYVRACQALVKSLYPNGSYHEQERDTLEGYLIGFNDGHGSSPEKVVALIDKAVAAID